MVEIPIKAKIAVDLSGMRTQLQGITKAAAASLSGATSSGSGGKNAPGIVDGQIISEALSPLITPILNILKQVLILLTPLAIIVVLLEVISGILNAFTSAFSNVFRVWSAILMLITKLYEPIVNLLIPIMIPVLIALGTAARIINTAMAPLFAVMMKIFGGGLGQQFGQLLGQYLAGTLDFSGFITQASALFSEAMTQLVASPEFQAAAQMLTQVIQAVLGALYGFLTMDFEGLQKLLTQYIGKDLANAVVGMIKAIQFFIGAIVGFAGQLMGAGNFDKLFGEGKFSELKEKNAGASVGAQFAAGLQAVYDFIVSTLIPELLSWVNFVKDTLIPALDDFIKNTWQNLKTTILTFISETWNNLKVAVDAFLKETWPNLKTALETFSTTINEWAKIDFKKMLQDAIDVVVSNFKKGTRMTSPAAGAALDFLLPKKNDFIMRPGGGAVSFSPDDTIIGVKDVSKLGGGTYVNAPITINGSNLSANELKAIVSDALESAMSRQSRNGHFQRGY